MLVQYRGDRCRLIRQNDHALLSGRLAQQWAGFDGWRPSGGMATGIALHDLPWAERDREPRWIPDSGEPEPFTLLPDGEREPLQVEGLAALERIHDWGGLLGSLHYARFLPEDEYPEFAAAEAKRQARLRGRLGPAAGDEDVERARRLLIHLDFLSLYVCLTAPGTERAPSWLSPDLVGESPEGTRYTLHWYDEGTLACDPFPFRRPFTLAVPYREMPVRFDSAEALREAWADAVPRFAEYHLRPAEGAEETR